MTIQTYETVDGVECVTWTDEQGTHSMTKAAYDEQQAALSTPIVSGDANKL